jgi:hypothetical protein
VSDFANTKVFTDGQLGVDGHDLNQITSQMFPNPDLITNKTLAGQPSANGTDQLLLCQGGTTLVRVPYSGFFLPSYVRAAAGVSQYVSTINGDMSVWQPGTSFANVATGTLTADMYKPITTLATGKATITQLDLAGSLVGGANNHRPRYGMRVTVATSQASLGAGEYFAITQRIERSQARKLFDNVSSLQVAVRSSVAGTFSFGVRNSDATQTYKQDFSVGTPGVWQRLTLQNIAIMPDASGNWGSLESDFCYEIDLTLGAGSTFQSATQNAWISGNFLGSSSQTNLFATGAATFDICLYQHESGAVCTPFLPDRSLSDTILKCSRYYTKSYDQGTAPGTVTSASCITSLNNAATATTMQVRYPVPMRAAGVFGTNLLIYSTTTGATGKVRDNTAAADETCSAAGGIGLNGFGQLTCTTLTAPSAGVNTICFWHYTVDASL